MKNIPISIRQNVYFDYLYITDFCRIIEWFIFNEPKHHTYNVCSGRKYSLLELANIVKEVSNKNIQIYVCKDGLSKEYTASNDRLVKEITGLEFTDMKTAIKNLYAYYESIENQIDLYYLLYQ